MLLIGAVKCQYNIIVHLVVSLVQLGIEMLLFWPGLELASGSCKGTTVPAGRMVGWLPPEATDRYQGNSRKPKHLDPIQQSVAEADRIVMSESCGEGCR